MTGFLNLGNNYTLIHAGVYDTKGKNLRGPVVVTEPLLVTSFW